MAICAFFEACEGHYSVARRVGHLLIAVLALMRVLIMRRGKALAAGGSDGLDQYRTPTDNRALLNRASSLAKKTEKVESAHRERAAHLMQRNREWHGDPPLGELSGSGASSESDDGEVVDLAYIARTLPSAGVVRSFIKAQVRAISEDYSDGEFA